MQHRPITPGRRHATGYLELSRRPLHILAFLLPLILLYETGSALFLADAARGTIETIRAHSIILGFFQDFGIVGRFLPAAALTAVLLAWHIFNADRWRLRPLVVCGMALESVIWTIPLVVLVALIVYAGGSAHAALAGEATMADMPWQARLTVSLGAGIYEEFLFRFIGIAALHLVFVDLVRLSDRVGTVLAVVTAAIAFTLYHDITLATGQIDVLKAITLLAAGIYFGAVFLARGFAIVVGVHALYDIFVLVILM